MTTSMTDPELKVLVERVNNFLDGQKRIEGQLTMLVQLQLSLTEQGQQIKSLESGQKRLFEKSDEIDNAIDNLREKEIKPIRDDMIGNRRAVRTVSVIGSLIIMVAGGIYSQWKPWSKDIQDSIDSVRTQLTQAKQQRDEQLSKWQYDVGQELRRDDNRLTVLEFRANNVDNKTTK